MLAWLNLDDIEIAAVVALLRAQIKNTRWRLAPRTRTSQSILDKLAPPPPRPQPYPRPTPAGEPSMLLREKSGGSGRLRWPEAGPDPNYPTGALECSTSHNHGNLPAVPEPGEPSSVMQHHNVVALFGVAERFLDPMRGQQTSKYPFGVSWRG
jgi:hypothetical protein